MRPTVHRVSTPMKNSLAWTAIGMLVLSACGPDRGTGNPASEPVDAGSQASPLPQLEVDDVTNDRRVALDAFVPSDRPTLIWFWAPH
jgi:hypothetical protein